MAAAAPLSAPASAELAKAFGTVAGTTAAAAAPESYRELNDFLKLTRQHWVELKAAVSAPNAPAPKQPQQVPEYHIVMGNEAGDMDSVVCAIVYAYYQHFVAAATTTSTAPKSAATAAAATATATATAAVAVRWLPLLNIPAKYLVLRADTVWLLARHGIDAQHLTFVDQCDGDVFAAIASGHSGAAGVRVCLVDHNRLTDAQSALGGRVTRIVDHHKDEALYGATTVPAASARTIQVVGSCTTLVAAEMLGRAARTSPVDTAVAQHCVQNPTVASLLAATILIDTANFAAEQKKATPADFKAFDALAAAAALPWAAPSTCCSAAAGALQAAVYAELLRLRSDCSSLPTAHLLLKDIKFGAHTVALHRGGSARVALAIASVPLALPDWMARDTEPVLRAGLLAFARENALHALVVMTTTTTAGAFARQLTVFVPTPFHAAPNTSAGAGAAAAGPGADASSALTPKALFDWLTQYLQTQTDLKLTAFDTKPYAAKAAAADAGAAAADAAAQPLVAYFVQANVAASRKQVFPFVTAAIAAAKL